MYRLHRARKQTKKSERKHFLICFAVITRSDNCLFWERKRRWKSRLTISFFPPWKKDWQSVEVTNMWKRVSKNLNPIYIVFFSSFQFHQLLSLFLHFTDECYAVFKYQSNTNTNALWLNCNGEVEMIFHFWQKMSLSLSNSLSLLKFLW